MSHPDPCYDPDNSYEDDEMAYNYDDHDDYYDDSMDGDFDSAMASAGHGTDEDYGYYGDPEEDNNYGYVDDYREDFHSDDAIGFVDYGEDGPYDD